MKTFEELWSKIETNFDFDRVAKVMEFLEWTWYFGNGTFLVPTKNQIIKEARNMALKCYTKYHVEGINPSSIRTGGFNVRYYEHKGRVEEHNELSIEFVLTEWDAW